MPIDIHLRLRHPQDAITLMELLLERVDEASDAIADDSDNVGWYQEVNEVTEAVWSCLKAQGFDRTGRPGVGQWHWTYQGRDLTLEKDLSFQPINSEGNLICLHPSPQRPR
jgi:hypothetical protein